MMLTRPITVYRPPNLDDARDEAERVQRWIDDSGIETAARELLDLIDHDRMHRPVNWARERTQIARECRQLVVAHIMKTRAQLFDARLPTLLDVEAPK